MRNKTRKRFLRILKLRKEQQNAIDNIDINENGNEAIEKETYEDPEKEEKDS